MTDPTSAAGECAGDSVKLIKMVEHIKQNNVAYLLGVLITYQLGILDSVISYASGICI